jgi:hypothetical protein
MNLSQLRVLGFGLLQDRNIGVSGFPEREKGVVSRLRFGGVARHGVGTPELEMRESGDWFIQHNTPMV